MRMGDNGDRGDGGCVICCDLIFLFLFFMRMNGIGYERI
jgi:hypothetical protein